MMDDIRLMAMKLEPALWLAIILRNDAIMVLMTVIA